VVGGEFSPLLWCLPSGSSEFQRGMSRVIARIAGPRTRISRSDDENAKCSAPGSAQRRDWDVGSAGIFYLAAPGIPEAFRARAKRDMTVPIGKAVISEIWR
jgi:hypothetical protein